MILSETPKMSAGRSSTSSTDQAFMVHISLVIQEILNERTISSATCFYQWRFFLLSIPCQRNELKRQSSIATSSTELTGTPAETSAFTASRLPLAAAVSNWAPVLSGVDMAFGDKERSRMCFRETGCKTRAKIEVCSS